MYTMPNPVDKQLSPLFTLGLLYFKDNSRTLEKKQFDCNIPFAQKTYRNLHVTFGVSSIFIAKILTFKQTDR